MRTLLVATALAASAPAALAEPTPARPDAAPPSAAAPFERREAWCQQYAEWVVSHDPAMTLPNDVRPTHRFETEFNSCKLDPQRYELETRADANTSLRSS